MTYAFALENFADTYAEMEPIYRRHYGEMQARLKADGVEIPPFAPRVDQYRKANEAGYMLLYIVRDVEGRAVGHSSLYLTNDMHNGEFMAQEDTIYILPEHRNGVGKRLVRFILDDLKRLGVKRVMITPVTDLRVGKIWQRMGFRPVAQVMTYTFP
jgi:GNAT superfamily N-acetyltransferase